MLDIFDILGPVMVGPSSSHTMGPSHAAALFKKEYPQADRFRAICPGKGATSGRLCPGRTCAGCGSTRSTAGIVPFVSSMEAKIV